MGKRSNSSCCRFPHVCIAVMFTEIKFTKVVTLQLIFCKCTAFCPQMSDFIYPKRMATKRTHGYLGCEMKMKHFCTGKTIRISLMIGKANSAIPVWGFESTISQWSHWLSSTNNIYHWSIEDWSSKFVHDELICYSCTWEASSKE